MNKVEQAEYLANLITIMDSRETAGLQRGQTIPKEYTKVYDEYIETIRKEHEDEARTKSNDDGRPQGRTEVPGDQPSVGRGPGDSPIPRERPGPDDPGSRSFRTFT